MAERLKAAVCMIGLAIGPSATAPAGWPDAWRRRPFPDVQVGEGAPFVCSAGDPRKTVLEHESEVGVANVTTGAGATSGQQAMREILDRFGFNAVSKQDRPYTAEDFVFEPSDYASARELRNVHEQVVLEETPLVLFRQIHLEHTARAHTSIRLRLGLCWNGFRDALTLLAGFPQSFQRAIPPAAIVNAAERYGTGDFGLAWCWSGEGEPDILAFVSNNVFVTIEGHDAAAVVLPLARELADALRKLRTGAAYGEERAGLLADVRRRVGEIPRLRPGERLDLGVLPEDGSTFFFLTSSGAVNRSTERTDSWYYRAGAERGRQEVILFRVGKGILPVMERLTVDVT